METKTDDVKARVRRFVAEKFLPGEDPDELTDDMPLISGGILDSISTVKLVAFLEDEYAVSFEAYEMNADYIDTLEMIEETINEKRREQA